jgi:hypothetical protein
MHCPVEAAEGCDFLISGHKKTPLISRWAAFFIAV